MIKIIFSEQINKEYYLFLCFFALKYLLYKTGYFTMTVIDNGSWMATAITQI